MGCRNLLSGPNSNHCLETTVHKPLGFAEIQRRILKKTLRKCGFLRLERVRKTPQVVEISQTFRGNFVDIFLQWPLPERPHEWIVDEPHPLPNLNSNSNPQPKHFSFKLGLRLGGTQNENYRWITQPRYIRWSWKPEFWASKTLHKKGEWGSNAPNIMLTKT